LTLTPLLHHSFKGGEHLYHFRPKLYSSHRTTHTCTCWQMFLPYLSSLCLWRSNVHFRFKLYKSLHEMFPHLYFGGFNTGFCLPCLLLMMPETQVFGAQYSIFERIDLQVLAIIQFSNHDASIGNTFFQVLVFSVCFVLV